MTNNQWASKQPKTWSTSSERNDVTARNIPGGEAGHNVTAINIPIAAGRAGPSRRTQHRLRAATYAEKIGMGVDEGNKHVSVLVVPLLFYSVDSSFTVIWLNPFPCTFGTANNPLSWTEFREQVPPRACPKMSSKATVTHRFRTRGRAFALLRDEYADSFSDPLTKVHLVAVAATGCPSCSSSQRRTV